MLTFVGETAGFGTPCLVEPLISVVFQADDIFFAGISFEVVQAADPTMGLGAAILAWGGGPVSAGSGRHSGWFVASSGGTSQKCGAG